MYASLEKLGSVFMANLIPFFRKHLRKKRANHFFQVIREFEKEGITILDVGGTASYWRALDCFAIPAINVTILNLSNQVSDLRYVSSVIGDALDLSKFSNNEFDIVFSNSVIEHVGGVDEQRRMAEEVRRVGRYYYIQTPNKYFPLEPHYFLPFFAFYPKWLKKIQLRLFYFSSSSKNFTINRAKNDEEADRLAERIFLLNRKEFQSLFPDADIISEKIFGMVK